MSESRLEHPSSSPSVTEDEPHRDLEWWEEAGYLTARPIEGGMWLAVCRMTYNWRLVICNPDCVEDFYCFEQLTDALVAFVAWDGHGDAPGPWHRHRATGRRREGGDPATEVVRW